MTHDERLADLAVAIGVPVRDVVPIVRAAQGDQPTHNAEGIPLLKGVDAQSTDQEVVLEAYRNIAAIRRGVGRR